MKKIVSIILLAVLISCQQNAGSSHDEAGETGHSHEGFPILVFSEGMELFAESGEIISGESIGIRAHLTYLDQYQPASKGQLFTRITSASAAADWTPLTLLQAGIFTGKLISPKPGLYSFEFRYVENGEEVIFSLPGVESVAEDKHEEEAEHAEGMPFTKEQAWKTEFGLQRISLSNFRQAIHCSGTVSSSPGRSTRIVSPARGVISFSNPDLIAGKKVNKGDVLFRITGLGVGDDNLKVSFNLAKADYEVSKADYERTQKLRDVSAASEKDLERTRAEFLRAEARYLNLEKQLKEGGLAVTCPVSGYISSIHVLSNAFVEEGSDLLEINSLNDRLIQAELSGQYASLLDEIESAKIKFPGTETVVSIDSLNGSIASIARTANPANGMLPVMLRVDAANLIPGSYVEVWLETGSMENRIVVPESSLIEEYGNYYVFVQVGGETYEKRLVKLGGFNGENYLVTDGLTPGEVIISRGAMAVKIVNAVGAPPAHTH